MENLELRKFKVLEKPSLLDHILGFWCTKLLGFLHNYIYQKSRLAINLLLRHWLQAYNLCQKSWNTYTVFHAN